MGRLDSVTIELSGNSKAGRNMEEKESWHLDKKVPIVIILAIVGQTFGAIWFAAKMDARLSAVEQFRDDSKGVATRLVVVETQISTIQADVKDIAEILRRIEAHYYGGGK